MDQTKTLVPRTGFRKVIEVKKEVPIIVDPTVNTLVFPGNDRAGLLLNPRSTTFRDIKKAAVTDSYISRSIAKYASGIFREGFFFSGENKKAIDYIHARLDMMFAATNVPWLIPIRQAASEYVQYGNGFLIKTRIPEAKAPFPVKKQGMRKVGKIGDPIGGYFPASVTTMEPTNDPDTGNLIGWEQRASGKTVQFGLSDVIHLTHNKPPGSIYGVPYLLPALDDVRVLRQCEEMIVHLIFKSLNPLMHHEVPDTTNTGLGDQRDVDRAAAAHRSIAPNGYICTPPGHKIHMIGVESKALRAEGYLRILKYRVFAGLGLNDAMMGESSATSTGVSDEFSAMTFDQIRSFQLELEEYFTYYILWELLLEGGFDPVFNPKDRVFWRFNEVDVSRKIMEESHWLLQYHGNILSETEVRSLMNLAPVVDRENMYLTTVQIPLAQSRSQSEAVSETGNSSNATESKQKVFTIIRSSLENGDSVETAIAKADVEPKVAKRLNTYLKRAVQSGTSRTGLNSKLHGILDLYL